MTAAAHGRSAVTHVEMVTLTIDDHEISVPEGTLVIRAAELMGVQIPRFCDHPLLDPVGACRQCLVDVEGQRKPLASCTTTVAEGMIVRTQVTSESAEKAQRGEDGSGVGEDGGGGEAASGAEELARLAMMCHVRIGCLNH